MSIQMVGKKMKIYSMHRSDYNGATFECAHMPLVQLLYMCVWWAYLNNMYNECFHENIAHTRTSIVDSPNEGRNNEKIVLPFAMMCWVCTSEKNSLKGG